ncbi:carbohydrate ABC transporter permease [Leifsonia shinshuensis]|uniref:carbohydrate ABC transporter permease n=1 Tax=Leifsonia shinshuensis TaxID=150026 RepID=UPI001F50FE84|nr:carbohydrate ABC transporter permease [Leifsonia shinshuensis]MCI0157091.1 carbohydrate ABC transporter permease [Leifsonia shinshuensis]
MRTRRIVIRTLQYIALAGFLLFLGFPFLWLISTAFKSSSELNSLAVNLVPSQPTLENFTDAFEAQGLVRAALNSIIVSVATTVIVVVISVPGAYVLARYRGKIRAMGSGWILVSQIVPVALFLLPLFFILRTIGLIDSLAGLVLVYVVYTLPFSLWMLQGFVAAIPVDVEEAGATDGATKLQVLARIVFPLLRPGLVATAIFTFVAAYNEFFFALVLLQSPENFTLSVALSTFSNGEGLSRIGPLAAGALIASIPSVVVFAILQRRLTGGLLAGAVKG